VAAGCRATASRSDVSASRQYSWVCLLLRDHIVSSYPTPSAAVAPMSGSGMPLMQEGSVQIVEGTRG